MRDGAQGRVVPEEIMKLYYLPLACSMASRITAYEADLPVTFIEVDRQGNRLPDGSDYHAVNPMDQVPAVMTGAGEVLSENGAVLQYLADQKPESGLAPQPGSIDRYRLQQWLSFIGTELHKQLFIPLLDPQSGEDVKAYARRRGERPLRRLDAHLGASPYLLDRFTIADAYLVTVLNWTPFCGLDLAAYPAVGVYLERLKTRPSIARALADETALYAAKKAS